MLKVNNLTTHDYRIRFMLGVPLQPNERVQLQRLILQCQGEIEERYKVLPGPSPTTSWYKVTARIAAYKLYWTIVFITLTRVNREKAYILNKT